MEIQLIIEGIAFLDIFVMIREDLHQEERFRQEIVNEMLDFSEKHRQLFQTQCQQIL